MVELTYNTPSEFRSVLAGKAAEGSDGLCLVTRHAYESQHTGFLIDEDVAIGTNSRFTYMMFEPMPSDKVARDQVLIITHGLNEGNPAKLFLWAYNLTRILDYPVVVFPLAFHMDRRSSAWDYLEQVQLTERRKQAGRNTHVSPFNTVISDRMSQNPDRFVRGGLQSFHDVIGLCDEIVQGRHAGFLAGATPHFLGYSAGGYLVLDLLLSDPGNRFQNSRSVLFATCVRSDDMNPDSIFILDALAGQRLMAFMDAVKEPLLGLGQAETALAKEPVFWLHQILSGGSCLEAELRELAPRILALAGKDDRILSADGMEQNLHPIPVTRLPTGVHEFPFALCGDLPDTFDRRKPETREMLSRVKHSRHVADRYRGVFRDFIESAARFLSESGT